MRTRNSIIKGFEGVVVFHDPLNMEQVFAIEEAQDNATEVEPSRFLTKINEIRGAKDPEGNTIQAAWSSRNDRLFIPAILLCVKEWQIPALPQPLTPETFPFTPRGNAAAFVDWLWSEVTAIYQGETEIPNESSPEPITTP